MRASVFYVAAVVCGIVNAVPLVSEEKRAPEVDNGPIAYPDAYKREVEDGPIAYPDAYKREVEDGPIAYPDAYKREVEDGPIAYPDAYKREVEDGPIAYPDAYKREVEEGPIAYPDTYKREVEDGPIAYPDAYKREVEEGPIAYPDAYKRGVEGSQITGLDAIELGKKQVEIVVHESVTGEEQYLKEAQSECSPAPAPPHLFNHTFPIAPPNTIIMANEPLPRSPRASTSSQEASPFLPTKEQNVADPGESAEERHQQRYPQRNRLYSILKRPLSIHVILIVTYTLITILVLRSRNRCSSILPPTSIQNIDRQFSTALFHNLTNNPYAGLAFDDVDAAWATLLAPMHIRVTAEELRLDDQASVALPEGGGFLGWMGVFHELHCVNMLRKWTYKSHYHGNLTREEEVHMLSHVDHCIDILRQTALCHADASLTTFVWHPQKSRPMFNASEAEHTCIDWPSLMASIADRSVSEQEVRGLENPLLAGHT